MARPQKQTVDYFPHRCRSGKTMFILETRYQDRGYTFWFKLLELLGVTEGHAYYLDKEDNREYLQAYTRTDKEQSVEILNLLANLDAIDKELWVNDHIIWSDNFVEGVKDAYRNRIVDIPVKPISSARNQPTIGVSDVRNPQSKVKKSKEDKSKGDNIEKISLSPVPEYKNVFMTIEEYQKLVALFNEKGAHDRIEELSLAIDSKGYKYKSHYATILNWDRRKQQERGRDDNGRTPKTGRYTQGGVDASRKYRGKSPEEYAEAARRLEAGM